MKRTITITIITLVIATLLMVINFQYQTKKDLYPMTMIVVDVNQYTDAVTMVDFNGNLWQFEGAEDWMVDDVVGCMMDSKGTDLIKDDEIVKVRYNGYFEGWN